MKIEIIAIGKTNFKFLEEGIKDYTRRLNHYTTLTWKILPDVKNVPNTDLLRIKEGDLLLKYIQGKESDCILLDENGKHYSSVELSEFIKTKMNLSTKSQSFIIGGAYGFSPSVLEKVSSKMSFSRFTFSHQMIRLLLVEQIYRSYSIIHNLPYHHE